MSTQKALIEARNVWKTYGDQVVLERLDLRAEGFAIEMEVIMKAADRRLVWAEVPVRALYQPGWRSQMRGGWDVWAIARFSLRC